MEATVKFRDPNVTICINGQRIHQTTLTQEDYEYLVSWNKSYADYFVPVEEKNDQPKAKKLNDGKEK